MRVVLVDDDPTVRAVTRRLVERAGHEVVGEAHDGELGLAVCRELEPDVVVMDLRMPKMTGTEAARLLRLTHPRIAVVMLTAFDEVAFQTVAENAGVVAYVVKGGDPATLLSALGEIESRPPGEQV